MVFRLLFCLISILSVHAAEREVWLVHYTAENNGFLTDLDLINSDFSSDHEVLVTPFSADGTALTDVALTVTIAAGSRMRLARADLGWQGQPVSHVRLSGEEAVRLSGVYRAATEDAMSASVTGVAQPTTFLRFTLSDNPAYFDGLVLVNPDAQQAVAADLSAHDLAGNTLQTTRVRLGPAGKWLAAVSGIFADLAEIEGYVTVSAATPFMAMGLRGSAGAVDAPVLTELALDRHIGTPAPVSFSNQVSRIVERNCAECHHEGGIGPVPFTDYEETAPLADLIAYQVSEGLMPPWKARTDCEPLREVLALDPAEKAMLLDWVATGAPEGDPARLPDPVIYDQSGWQLGEPDAVLQYAEPYFFEAGADQYQCFPIALGNNGEVQLDAIEILPDNDAIVHHVLVFVEDNTIGQDLDAMEEGPGYTCFGGPGTGGFRLVAGWAPGMAPIVMPEDVGITIEPNATAIVQIHYSYSFTSGTDQTSVGFHYSEAPRGNELLFLPLVNDNFVIPAGADDYAVTQSFTIPFGLYADLYFIAPHMHLLGKNISVEAEFLDGTASCLIDVPRWDFNWQRFYQYPDPIRLGWGTKLTMRAIYDNTAQNPFNPSDPPIDVGWGEATTDEMALAFLGVVTPFISLKDEVGKWTWPLMPRHGITPPDEVRASLEAKRRVKPCCNDLAAERAGAGCPSPALTER